MKTTMNREMTLQTSKFNLIGLSLDQIKALINQHLSGLAGIYLWTNNTTGKQYVGSTLDLKRRMLEYINISRTKRELLRGHSIIYSALLKYGIQDFTLEILELVDPGLITKEEISRLETQYITLYNPAYNILSTAYTNFGHKLSTDTRLKISLAKKGYNIGPLNHRTGITHTKESILLIRDKKSSKPLLVYYPDGTLFKEFISSNMAAQETGINRTRIMRNLGKILDNKFYFKLKTKGFDNK